MRGVSAVGAEIHGPWLVGGEIRRFGVYQLDLGDLIGDVRGPEVPDVAHDRKEASPLPTRGGIFETLGGSDFPTWRGFLRPYEGSISLHGGFDLPTWRV